MNSKLKLSFLIIAIVILGAWFFWTYLNRALDPQPVPAEFNCLNLNEGRFTPFDSISGNIYGVGLAYAGHINETASEFDPKASPPVFIKSAHCITKDGATVKIPSYDEMIESVEKIEKNIKEVLKDHPAMPPLMDYETELGLILLDDIERTEISQKNYIPRLGFFVGNDLTARSLMVLGEGQANKYDYWGIAKSFQGFLPVSDQIWIPDTHKENAIPCVNLSTYVNGQLMQNANTSDLIYTPRQMIQFVFQSFPELSKLNKGDIIMTGTPGGVLFTVPRWKVRLSNLFGLDRLTKLKIATKPEEAPRFLSEDDVVEVKAEGLGKVSVILGK